MIQLCEVVSIGVQYFGSTLCTRTWYQSVYEEPLSVLIKIWNRCCWKSKRVFGFGFSVHLWPVGAVPLRPKRRFHWEIFFCFTENRFRLLQKHPFQQIWRYNFTVTDLFFLNISYFISLLLDLLCFSLGILFFLTTYALCRAPCAIAVNKKQ